MFFFILGLLKDIPNYHTYLSKVIYPDDTAQVSKSCILTNFYKLFRETCRI